MSGDFIALKACRFGTNDFGVGELIPADVVLHTRVKKLIKQGRIAYACETPKASSASGGDTELFTELTKRNGELVRTNTELEAQVDQLKKLSQQLTEQLTKEPDGVDIAEQVGIITMAVPVRKEDEWMTLEMPVDEIVGAIRISQLNAKDAVEIVETLDSENILILINQLVEWKTVKEAIRVRALQLMTEGEDENQGDT